MDSSSSSSSLAPGFRFHPTDEELVIYYLKRKVCGRPFRIDAISEIDIYKFEPWDLPDRSKLKSRDLEWYFFSALDKKYGNGWRTNRATDQGYWKTTGKDRSVYRGEKIVGMKKTLVFHIGRAPHGERTNWVMHEYRLVDEELTQAGIAQDAFVLCRVFHKSGPGPKNGEKYGAPFIEEEWDDNVLVVKGEFCNDGYSAIAGDEYLLPQQQEEFMEDHALAFVPQNEFQVGTDGGDNLPENPESFFAAEKKVFIGAGENVRLLELPDEKLFISPEQFQIDDTPNENEYFSLDDFLNPAEDNYHVENPVDGELTYLDALQDLGDIGSFTTVDNPNSYEADEDEDLFGMLGEYLQYEDTGIDSTFLDLKPSVLSEAGVTFVSQSDLTGEVNAQNEQADLALPVSSETQYYDGSSSSEKTPEATKVASDVKYNRGWDSTIAKQVSRMLGSISAPTAFAAETPTKEAAFGQNSAAAQASTSVHVTAGVVHISGMSVVGGEKIWSLAGKSGTTTDLMLPYGLTMGNVHLMSNSLEPMGNSKATAVILRSGFYFMFLWVLILSLSCKIGTYIYTR